MDEILDGKGQGPAESNRSSSSFTFTLPELSFVELSFAPSMIVDISNTIKKKKKNKIVPKFSDSSKLLFFFSQQLSFFKFKMVLVTFAPKIHKAAA